MTIDGSTFITKPSWLRISVGVALVVAAVLMANFLWLVVDRPINSPLFLCAMILSAWLLGFRVGVLTAIASGVAMKYFFVLPYHQLMGDRQVMVRVAVFVIEGIILAWLIERLRVASDRIRTSREELRALTEHQRSVRESEQKRIALEIHDELGQSLTGLKMDIHFLNRQVSQPNSGFSSSEISKNLIDLSKVVDGTISAIRRIASELRPSVLDDFGLIAAIEWQTQEFERKTGTSYYFKADVDSLDLGTESNTAVFRIFQEALTNIARHADAKKVRVNIQKAKDTVVMSISDDGSGIDMAAIKQKHSLGILGMQERSRLIGADLNIGPASGGGTSVRLTVPANTGVCGKNPEVLS
jgi:signal transduction histidine kinase